MKTNIMKSLTIFAGASIIAVSACKKEENIVPPSPVNTNNGTSALGSFFTANEQAATQSFTIDASTYQNIIGAKGTRIYFSPNTFKTPSGAIATGNITIKLIEIQSKADMILLNKTTTSNGKLLISGGEFSVKAFQNGSQLTLASNNSSMYVQMPSENPGSNNMILFAGQQANLDGGDVNWALTGLNGPNNVVQPDSIAGGGYSFALGSDSIPTNDSLGWTNVDQFATITNGTFITVNTPTNFHGGVWSSQILPNTKVYIFFNNLNSVANLYWNSINNNWDLGPYVNLNYPGFPVGSQIKIVAISEINGQYYSSITPATITSNFSLNITLNPTTAAAITNDINNL